MTPELPLLPTSLVGSYAQPNWLIDRARLAERFPPRVRARELWRVAPEFLREAKDDATVLAIRAQERAGLDIITDGEVRRESYSNHFATALEGVDIDNPGTALDRTRHPNPVPRVVGPVRRPRPVQVEDVRFLRATTDRAIKATVPGPFTMTQQAQNDHYPDQESLAADYAAAVREEVHDLFAAGADIVQLDEPYLQARPDEARAYGLRTLNAALEGAPGTTAVHVCFGYAAIVHERPRGYSFLPELADCPVDQISVETPVRARPGGARRPERQDDRARGAGPVDRAGRVRGGRGRPGAPRLRPGPAGAAGHRPGLRDEVPAASGGRGQAPRDGACRRGAAALSRSEQRAAADGADSRVSSISVSVAWRT